MAALALEIKHRIDHVFEHPRAGDLAFFGDVADEEQHRARALGMANQFLSGAAHLRHRAGRRIESIEIHRLDRIDNDDIGRFGALQAGQDIAYAGRGSEKHRRIADPETGGAQADLLDPLLAGYIGGAEAVRRQRAGSLQKKGGFADPRIAGEEHTRAGH